MLIIHFIENNLVFCHKNLRIMSIEMTLVVGGKAIEMTVKLV